MFSVHDQSGNVWMITICQISGKTSPLCLSFLRWAWRQRKSLDVDLVHKGVVCHFISSLLCPYRRQSRVFMRLTDKLYYIVLYILKKKKRKKKDRDINRKEKERSSSVGERVFRFVGRWEMVLKARGGVGGGEWERGSTSFVNHVPRLINKSLHHISGCLRLWLWAQC